MSISIIYIVAILTGYLLGSLNLAYFLSNAKGLDLRKTGSGNLGASNTVLGMGMKAGAAVAAHDIIKGIIAVLVIQYLCPGYPHIGFVSGAAAVLGHMFPFYLAFHGGKGFATFIGLMAASDWKIAILLIIAATIVAFLSDRMVGATFTIVTLYPVTILFCRNDIIETTIVACISCIILIKHRENIQRIKNGTETSLREALGIHKQ